MAGLAGIYGADVDEVKRRFSEIRRQLPGAKHSLNNRRLQERFAREYQGLKEAVQRVCNRVVNPPASSEEADGDSQDFITRWKNRVLNEIDAQKAKGRSARSAILKEWLERLRNGYGVDKMFRRYAGVLGGTCLQAGAGKFELVDTPFDYVIIDEAARANPLDLLVPMVMGRRVIMVGDHRQLPHIIEHKLKGSLEERMEKPEMMAVFEDSIFARLWGFLPGEKRCLLDTQCRMHPSLGRMVSELFYEGSINSSPETESLVNDTVLYPGRSLVWVPVEGSRAGPYTNEEEANAIVSHLIKLRDAGNAYSVGVISFYRRQVDLIKRKMAENGLAGENIKVDTVDAFQGRQREIILLSTVRTRGRSLGFTAMPNRQNVALSRARRLLLVFGNAEFLGKKNINFEQLYRLCQGGQA